MSLWVLMVLLAAPHASATKPSNEDMVRLYFVNGELDRAINAAGQMLRAKQGGKALYKALVEYQSMTNHQSEFTTEKARKFLELDGFISPNNRSVMTRTVYERWVRFPVVQANEALKQGDKNLARKILEQVMKVEPENVDVREKLRSLRARIN